MKYWKCPVCHYRKETEDKIKICFCNGCLYEMVEVEG